MTRYLVAIHHPDDYDPAAAEDETMRREIGALNQEMIAAGVREFVGGLHPVKDAKSLRMQPGGKVLVTDGPYLEPRNTSPASGCWNAPAWTRRWRGGARRRSPAGRRSRCGRSFRRGRTSPRKAGRRAYARRARNHMLGRPPVAIGAEARS